LEEALPGDTAIKSSRLALISLVLALAFLLIFLVPLLIVELDFYINMRMNLGYEFEWVKYIQSENIKKVIDPFYANYPETALYFFLAGPIGLICAIVSLIKIGRSTGKSGGAKSAIWAIIIIVFGLFALFMIAGIPGAGLFSLD